MPFCCDCVLGPSSKFKQTFSIWPGLCLKTKALGTWLAKCCTADMCFLAVEAEDCGQQHIATLDAVLTADSIQINEAKPELKLGN